MRLGLFGKILVAFWATLLALGLVLTLTFRASTPKEDRPFVRLAPSLLQVLANTLEREGYDAAERERRLFVGSISGEITLVPVGGKSRPVSGAHDDRLATAPNGAKFLLSYHRIPSSPFSNISVGVLLSSVFAGLFFSVLLARYLSRPIRVIRKGFHRLATGNLDIRLGPVVGKRNDEIADLARDFDLMAERLGALVTARDRLLHDVSHELRSPLTRMQLAIGLARQDAARRETSLHRIEQEARKLDALVDELLTLARAESGADSSEFFDPVGVVEAVVAGAGLEAEAKNVALAVTPMDVAHQAHLVAAGSADLFYRAVENVVRNAIRFSPEGGTVETTMDLLERPLRWRLMVRDSGPGVPPELLGKLLEPFVRADRSGTGLGLAIANRAVTAHGGKIVCRNREEGGFAVEIEIGATQLVD